MPEYDYNDDALLIKDGDDWRPMPPSEAVKVMLDLQADCDELLELLHPLVGTLHHGSPVLTQGQFIRALQAAAAAIDDHKKPEVE